MAKCPDIVLDLQWVTWYDRVTIERGEPMPRKVSLPPTVIRIESLSDGREIRNETFVSDIGKAEVLPMVQDPSPARVMKSGDQLIAEAKNKRIAADLDMLKAVGIVHDDRPKPPPKPSIPNKPGMRAIKLGQGHVIYSPLPPGRRF